MKRFGVLIACLLSAVMIGGCSTRWVQSPVVEQENMMVSLEHRVVKGDIAQKQYNHPYDMDSRDLKVLFTQLDYLDEPAIYGDPEQKPVFQKEEIDRLAPALTDALAAAEPHQRVRFISYNRGGGLLFRKDRKTRGVLFVEAGHRLNLAFSYVNYEIREKELQRFSPAEETLNPLAVKSSDTPIVVPAYAAHKQMADGGKYPMWIRANMDKIEQAAKAVPESQPQAPSTETAEPAKTDKSTADDKQPAAESQPAEKAPAEKMAPEPTAPKAAPESKAKSPADAWESRKAEIKERLEYLKDLYESDLIDTEEYDAQKKKLLKQLELNPN